MSKKTAIIGDIHGCNDQLLELLDKLPKDIDQIYTTGDLIDRGPDSKGVVQTCIDRKIKCVQGNHESMFLDFVLNKGVYQRGLFEMNGGTQTLKSYMTKEDDHEVEVDIPESHLTFLINAPYYIETDDFVLTHAGITVEARETFRDMSQESKDAVMWNRGSISGGLKKLQVFGHSIVEEAHFISCAVDGVKTCIAVNVDTGCFTGKKLTALLLPSMETISVEGWKGWANV